MSEFKLTVEAGRFRRSNIRTKLNIDKDNLESLYKGSNVTIREEKSWLKSDFYISGTNFPDTKDFERYITDWYKSKSH